MKRLFLLIAILPLIASAQQKKIVAVSMGPGFIEELNKVSPNVRVVAADMKNLVDQVADADAILGTISPALFASAKKLKWVQTYSAGVEVYRFPEFLNSDVTLTNCKIIQGPITVIPNACARWAICCPMPPIPTISAVFPRSSSG